MAHIQGSSRPHSMFHGDNILRIGNSGDLPSVSSVIQVRRLQFAGHWYRSKNEVVNRVILWEPRRGRRSRGRPVKSYINILVADTGAESSELLGLMGNREWLKTVVDSARARSAE